MPRLLEVATCVAERYPSLRIFCETNARVTRLPYPFSQRSHVCNLRQTIQGKGVKIRGWKPQVSTLLCPRRVGALPAEVQQKTPRPERANTLTQFEYPAQPVQKRSRSLGANTLTQFASPGQPVPKRPPARFASPRLPYTAKTKKAPLTRCLSLLRICRLLSSSSCRNYRSRRRYYHHRYHRNRSRRCPDRSIPRSR